jgi:hypothetical protein
MMVPADRWAPALVPPMIMLAVPAAVAAAMIRAGHRAGWPLSCGSRQAARRTREWQTNVRATAMAGAR